MESTNNGADNDARAPDATEIVVLMLMHSANWHISISVVIDNSVPEKSFKSVIMDNVAHRRWCAQFFLRYKFV